MVMSAINRSFSLFSIALVQRPGFLSWAHPGRACPRNRRTPNSAMYRLKSSNNGEKSRFEINLGVISPIGLGVSSKGAKCGAPHFVQNPEYNKIRSK